MFTVYTKPDCTFCDQAKALLNQKNLPYHVVELDVDQPKTNGRSYITREKLLEQYPGTRTMPLIIDASGNRVGGYTELKNVLNEAR